MASSDKYNQILDALEKLIADKNIQSISVSEIAQAAGIGKGSIYYYFSSKEEILNALIARNYEVPLQTAKKLAGQEDVDPFIRMAMLFQACRNVSGSFVRDSESNPQSGIKEQSFLHHKYFTYLITELKPVLTKIITQAVEQGRIDFEYPAALAEIVLIVLVVKFDKALLPTTPEETEETMKGFVRLLEAGAKVPEGTLRYLEESE